MNWILRNAIRAIFMAPEGGDGGGGSGAPAGGNGSETPPQVKPEDARAFLKDVIGEESVKELADDKVLALHGRVSGATQKLVDARVKEAVEKAKGDGDAARKAAQEKWTKGELKLELSKDSKLQQSDVDEIAAVARERGLSMDEAKAELAAREKAVTAFETRQVEAFKAQRSKWVEEIKSDPEIGGDNLAQTQKLAMLAIERFYPPELREHLRMTGFGDHPLMVKLARNIGAAMAEDKPGQGGGIGNAGGEKKSPAQVLYGK